MNFVGLQNLSTYSFLKSPTAIADLVTAAKERGYLSLALTDINYTYGLVEFYQAAKKAGIKPLLGLQEELEGLILLNQKFRLIFLAKNQNGYQNLLKMSSALSLKPELATLTAIQPYLEDLIIMMPSTKQGELKAVYEQSPNQIEELVEKLLQLVPNVADLYFGVYANQFDQYYQNFMKDLAEQYHLQLVALEDVEYLNPEDQFLKKVLTAVANNEKLPKPLDLVAGQGSHALMPVAEVTARYQEFELLPAVENTVKIADAIDFELQFSEPSLPHFPQTQTESSKKYLNQQVVRGLQQIFPHQEIPTAYQERANHELKIINQMGFADYFLIVQDAVNFARKQHIPIGPGRGSAAGSLISYALGITKVDPIKYNLLFERFLNPERRQMPDIDLDISDLRRQELLDYLYRKYGMDHLAQIITFGTFGTKGALRDVGRVFGLSQLELKRWSSLTTGRDVHNLSEAKDKSRELQTLVAANDFNQLIFATAVRLEQTKKNYSTHAAGVVLSDSSLASSVGLRMGSTEISLTQQSMQYVEELGLLKIDFLGLRNLSLLEQMLEILRLNKTPLELEQIDLNDPLTLEVFQKGETEGIFQFDSSDNAKKILQQIHPESFAEIVAANALNRPGPSANIPTYVARKNDPAKVKFQDPRFKEILGETYGIMLYQEQVMQVAEVFAGFTLGDADLLRRAISKKKPELIEQQRRKFIEGAQKLGHDLAAAEKVFSYIERFGGYGFNKSHAVSYSMISFWLAYIKAHYPSAFYLALINQSLNNQPKVNNYLNQLQFLGTKILLPDINESYDDYRLLHGHIQLGLLSVQGVTKNFVSAVLRARSMPFKSVMDFLHRIDVKVLNVEVMMNLIKAGAFDQVEPNRRQVLESIKSNVESVKLANNNTSIFDILVPKVKEVADFSASEKRQQEAEVTGLNLAINQLIDAKNYTLKLGGVSLSQLELNKTQLAYGQIEAIKEIKTSKDEPMAFIEVFDGINTVSVTIFPKVYQKVRNLLTEHELVLLKIHTQPDRYHTGSQQYILEDLKLFHFKRSQG